MSAPASWIVAAGLVVLVAGPLRGEQGVSATYSVAGVVIDDQVPGVRVRRAIVTISGASLPREESTITDENGRFRFESLKPGTLTLTAARPGFVTSAFGAIRPGRPGTPIQIGSTDNDYLNLSIRVWRGATIAGRVMDESGSPASGVVVKVVRVKASRLTTDSERDSSSATSDDRGGYRIWGLEPGSYLVSAVPPRLSADPPVGNTRVDELLADLARRVPGSIEAPHSAIARIPRFDYAPVYFPGSPSVDDAATVEVTAGQEATGTDFVLRRFPVAAVSGTVRLPNGDPSSGATVRLIAKARLSGSLAPTATSRSDGSFEFPRVSPGSYELVARGPQAARSTGANELTAATWASTEIQVDGFGMSAISLTLTPGLNVAGRLMFRGDEATPTPDLSRISVALLPDTTRGLPSGPALPSLPAGARLGVDGQFRLQGLQPGGRYRLVYAGVDPLWQPLEAKFGAIDLFDGPATIRAEDATAPLDLVFSSALAEIRGQVRTSAGKPASDLFVILVEADPQTWGVQRRGTGAIRPNSTGHYVFSGLRPGNYVIAVTTDFEDSDWTPEFIRELVGSGFSVALASGQKRVQDLSIR